MSWCWSFYDKAYLNNNVKGTVQAIIDNEMIKQCYVRRNTCVRKSSKEVYEIFAAFFFNDIKMILLIENKEIKL